MQMLHLEDSGHSTAAGYCLEADLEPFSPGLQDLVRSMLQHVLLRKSADVLLTHPILAQLPEL